MTIKVIAASIVEMIVRGGPPGEAHVGRAVSSDISPSMGAGFAEFNRCSIVWTVLYDEIVYVIDGVFIVKTNSQTYTAQKGEVMWIPKGTELSYQGEEARIFYVVYPGNWKEPSAP